MSSGWGLNGKTGRCFGFFQDFAVCMKERDEPILNCTALRNDYLECLHHKKEAAKKKSIRIEAERQKAELEGGGGSSVGHH